MSITHKDKEKQRQCKHRYWLKIKSNPKMLKQKYNISKKSYEKHKDRKQFEAMLNHSKVKVILSELKINGCVICGYNKEETALDFHHVEPKYMKFRLTINGLKHKDIDIVDELNKCMLLCSNCHREITQKERGY